MNDDARWKDWDTVGDLIRTLGARVRVLEVTNETANETNARLTTLVATLTDALEKIDRVSNVNAIGRLTVIRRITRAALEAASQQNGGTVDDTTHSPSLDGLEQAWVVIANVSEGDWTKQTPEWQEAARRWRDEVWHVALEAASQEAPNDE